MGDIEFRAWPKIARLNRDIVITEKIDGTNAAVGVTEDGQVYAQSRSRIITPEADNFGFAAWVAANSDHLREFLGHGLHFGEWWGSGIQRGYGLPKGERRFSLFDVARFRDRGLLFESGVIPGLGVVPVLYEGPFGTREATGLNRWEEALDNLAHEGSAAAPGFMDPEGIVVYHTASREMFKVTLKGDDQPKGAAA